MDRPRPFIETINPAEGAESHRRHTVWCSAGEQLAETRETIEKVKQQNKKRENTLFSVWETNQITNARRARAIYICRRRKCMTFFGVLLHFRYVARFFRSFFNLFLWLVLQTYTYPFLFLFIFISFIFSLVCAASHRTIKKKLTGGLLVSGKRLLYIWFLLVLLFLRLFFWVYIYSQFRLNHATRHVSI